MDIQYSSLWVHFYKLVILPWIHRNPGHEDLENTPCYDMSQEIIRICLKKYKLSRSETMNTSQREYKKHRSTLMYSCRESTKENA